MLHHIVFDDILNYIVIVLKYELWIRICREKKIMCTLVSNIIYLLNQGLLVSKLKSSLRTMTWLNVTEC